MTIINNLNPKEKGSRVVLILAQSSGLGDGAGGNGHQALALALTGSELQSIGQDVTNHLADLGSVGDESQSVQPALVTGDVVRYLQSYV